MNELRSDFAFALVNSPDQTNNEWEYEFMNIPLLDGALQKLLYSTPMTLYRSSSELT